MNTAEDELSEPQSFGDYVLHRRIAQGGMAEIFLAEKKSSIANFSRVVVLKRMLPHLERGEYVKMFLDEARLASRLSHPNVVQVHDFGEAEGRYFLVMEYLAGETLSVVLRRHARTGMRVPPNIVISVVRSMLEGLHYAHEYRDGGKAMHVVHRDVSPSNVLVTYQGSVKLVDFGIARATGRIQEKTETGVLKGKRAYASPEQYRGQILDRRADIWATGVVLHELCTGERLFRRDTPEATMLAVLSGDIPDPRAVRDDLPDELYPVILRALARDRGERYQTAREMSRELEALLQGPPPRIGEWLRGLFGDERAEEVLEVRDGISKIERLSSPPEPTTPLGARSGTVELGATEAQRTRVDRPRSGSRSETPPPLASETPPPTSETPPSQGPPSAIPRRSRGWTLAFVVMAVLAAAAVGYGIRGAEAPGESEALGESAEAVNEARRESFARAFGLAQTGAHEEARVLLDAHLSEYPDDVDARVLRLFVQWWASAPRIDTQLEQARSAALDEVQRDTVEGLAMVNRGRTAEAVAYLEPVADAHPDRPEPRYVLGEALWHGQRYREGAEALTAVLEADSAWQIALHHSVDFHLDQGDADRVRALADLVEAHDPARAAALRGQAAMAEERYAHAIALLETALDGDYADEPHLWVALAEARLLANDYAEAEFAVERAFETWPVDDREVGGAALRAELALYEGNLAAFARSGTTHVGCLMDALWRGQGSPEPRRPSHRGILSPPLDVMAHFEGEHARGRDEEVVWNGYPEPDLAALGEGLTHERAGRNREAAETYARGLAEPQSGWTRMLLSHHLARARVALGDQTGAAEACEAVLRPRVYRTYRAVVLPDCELWTARAADDPAAARAILHRLVDRWTGSFDHPAVVEARRLLAAE